MNSIYSKEDHFVFKKGFSQTPIKQTPLLSYSHIHTEDQQEDTQWLLTKELDSDQESAYVQMSHKKSMRVESSASKPDNSQTQVFKYLDQSQRRSSIKPIAHDEPVHKHYKSISFPLMPKVEESFKNNYLQVSLKHVDSKKSKHWNIYSQDSKMVLSEESLSVEKFNAAVVPTMGFYLALNNTIKQYSINKIGKEKLLSPDTCNIESLTEALTDLPNRGVFSRGEQEMLKLKSGKAYSIIQGRTYFIVYSIEGHSASHHFPIDNELTTHAHASNSNSISSCFHIHYLKQGFLISQSFSSTDQQLISLGRKQCDVNVDDVFISKRHGFFSYDKTNNSWIYCMSTQENLKSEGNESKVKQKPKLPLNKYWRGISSEDPLVIAKSVSLMKGPFMLKLEIVNSKYEDKSRKPVNEIAARKNKIKEKENTAV